MTRWRYRRLNQGTSFDEWQVYEVGTLAHAWSFPPGHEEQAGRLAGNLNTCEAQKATATHPQPNHKFQGSHAYESNPPQSHGTNTGYKPVCEAQPGEVGYSGGSECARATQEGQIEAFGELR